MNKYFKLIITIIRTILCLFYTIFKFLGIKLAIIIIAILFITGLINRQTYLLITLAFSSFTVLEIVKELGLSNNNE